MAISKRAGHSGQGALRHWSIAAAAILLALGQAVRSAETPSRFLAYTDQQAIVVFDNPQGLYPAAGFGLHPQWAMPKLFGDQPVRIANISVAALEPAFVTTEACEQHGPTRLVVCLDATLSLTAEQQLAALAFAKEPVIAYARTSRAAQRLRKVLDQSPEHADRVRIRDQQLKDCGWSCERVIVLEQTP